MNMIDYVQNNLSTFEEMPLNEIDSVIFSWLTYFKLEINDKINPRTSTGCSIRDLFYLEYFPYYLAKIHSPKESIELLSMISASPRFRNVTLHYFTEELDKEANKQFSAVTFKILDNLYYVAYRGTDTTLTGWKEDFYLSIDESTAGQIEAKEYLEKVVGNLKGDFIVGGHSKGGNLAVYAAASCNKKTQDRIIQVYSHDGPGFSAEELEKTGFQNIRSRIRKTIPQSSMIGMIFEPECEYTIVQSKSIGILQHNPMNWQIEDNHFVLKDKLNHDSSILYHKVNNWFNSMTQEEKIRFTESLFKILEATGATDFEELGSNLKKNIPIIIKEISLMDKDTQKFMKNTLYLLITSSSKNEDSELDEDLEKMKE